MGTDTGQVMTLCNSIIGVSVLAMPYCFKQCGIVLSVLLLCFSSILSRLSCHFLLKSAIITRRRNYEFLAFHVFGSSGKLGVELAIIGFLLGTCIAFFVVMGDLGPAIISSMFGLHRSDTLRTSILLCMALFVVLPLGLLRNVDSLSSLCTASFAFYLCLVLKVMGEATAPMVAGDWLNQVNFWRPEGLLQCLPIFSMALFCQTQLFEIFDTVPNAALDKLNAVVRSAINMCTAVYIFVGFFGYIAFYKENITGNILVSLSETMSSEVIKLGFVLSVAVSFPLVIFPCRASLYSLLYKSAQPPVHDIAASHVPEGRFKFLTFAIVGISLVVGLVLPNIERVLGIIGSTIGVTICIITPSLLLGSTARHPKDKLVSQIILWSGAVIMVLGTYAHILNVGESVPVDSGLEQAANRILDHAMDQLNEQPHEAMPFKPISLNENLKKLIETPAENLNPRLLGSLSDKSKGNVQLSVESNREKSSDIRNDKENSVSIKLKESAVKSNNNDVGEGKPQKLDGKSQEPAAPADTGEKQQEPPVPVEAVIKHASAEPNAAVNSVQRIDPVVEEAKPGKKKIRKKEQHIFQKNSTILSSNADQVNQDAIRHEDAESALEAKADKAMQKQNEIEEQKKKEEENLIETLKEHQEVQRDMLNEQQRILQELKKHEKIHHKTVNEVVKDSPADPNIQKSRLQIPNNILPPVDPIKKQNDLIHSLGSKDSSVSKLNISALAINQLQPPAAPVKISDKLPLPKPKEVQYRNMDPAIPLPLAYSAKAPRTPESLPDKPGSQSVEPKPAARDILESEPSHAEREKRDVTSSNSTDTEQGAGYGPLVELEQKQSEYNKNFFKGAPDEECQRGPGNTPIAQLQSKDLHLPITQGQDSSVPMDKRNNQGKESLLGSNGSDGILMQTVKGVSKTLEGEPAAVMELKTPSSISEPQVEINVGFHDEDEKLLPQNIPLPAKQDLKSVQSKESQ